MFLKLTSIIALFKMKKAQIFNYINNTSRGGERYFKCNKRKVFTCGV
jgi:hypothetical protein